jgi:hypothetical protein
MDRVPGLLVALALTLAACDRTSEPAVVDASAPSVASSTATVASAPPTAPSASSGSPLADKDRACDLARTALAEFASTFPTKCTGDSDCNGYYVGATACEPALVLTKPGVPLGHEPQLVQLQGAVRESCLAPSAACSPRPFRARCKTGRCIDELRAK